MAQQYKLGSRGTTARTDAAGTLSVVYHQTEVVSATPTTIRLNSGGWRTLTTKTRMNQAANQYGLGFTVSQRDFSWFVEYGGRVIPFEDGMTINRGGDA